MAISFTLDQAFFKSAAEKTKTQAKNSRKKLNFREALSSFLEKLKGLPKLF